MNNPLLRDAAGSPVAVEYFRNPSRPDRWMHRVVFLNEGLFGASDPKTLLASIEGDDQQLWPPSPPVQDLDRHQLSDGDAMLGVGMAGKSHWSISASVAPHNGTADQAEGGGFFFDMACLIKEAPELLGSAYLVSEGVSVEQDSGMVRLAGNGVKLIVQPLSEGPAAATITVDQNSATGRTQLMIRPFTSPADNLSPSLLPRSVRWQYRVRTDA